MKMRIFLFAAVFALNAIAKANDVAVLPDSSQLDSEHRAADLLKVMCRQIQARVRADRSIKRLKKKLKKSENQILALNNEYSKQLRSYQSVISNFLINFPKAGQEYAKLTGKKETTYDRNTCPDEFKEDELEKTEEARQDREEETRSAEDRFEKMISKLAEAQKETARDAKNSLCAAYENKAFLRHNIQKLNTRINEDPEDPIIELDRDEVNTLRHGKRALKNMVKAIQDQERIYKRFLGQGFTYTREICPAEFQAEDERLEAARENAINEEERQEKEK